MEAIKVENFSCYYKLDKGGYVTALDKVSFSVESGEMLTVIGESGGGKTTLLRCMLGLNDYTSGTLLMGGISADALDVADNNMAYVRQEIVLYPQMTVYENIAFPLRVMHTPQAELDARVKAIADTLDIRWLLTRKPGQLSGGQQQRVALARALVKRPQFILFDEPFANVDPSMRGQLRLLIKKLHQMDSATMVFVTHDIDEAFFLGDKILVLDTGKVEAFGTPEELRNCRTSALLNEHFGRNDMRCF
jgi:ABC-type sugar transport system ATPase subunit